MNESFRIFLSEKDMDYLMKCLDADLHDTHRNVILREILNRLISDIKYLKLRVEDLD